MTSFIFEIFFLNSLVVRNKVSYLKTNPLCLWVFPKFYPCLFNTAYICFLSKIILPNNCVTVQNSRFCWESINVRCLSVEIFSLRLFISFRLNGPFLQRLKELEFCLKPMTHGWTNAVTNKFTHIRAILQTHFWTLLNDDKDKLYSVTGRYSVTILHLLQTRVIENFWRSQKMAQLWVEHLSIFSDKSCKPAFPDLLLRCGLCR